MKKLTIYCKKNSKKYLVTGLGSTLMAIAINTFFLPHHMLSGGTSGIAIIFYLLFNIPIGVQVMIMNIPIFYSAYKLLDRDVVINGLYGMLVFSLVIDATKFLTAVNLTDDILLAALLGGVIFGVGAGLVFRVNGNTGGTDIVALIIKKYYGLDIGSVLFAINCALMMISTSLFGFKPAMYTLLSMYVCATVTDRTIEGFNRKKTITIISDHCDLIASTILKEIGRGVTFLHGEGAFTNQDRKIIFVVVTLTQVAKIKLLIDDIDPKTFMIVQDAADVSGRGFTD
jgi:uncharacterized membrane-anchored protein YitT (DUF2179 family)